MPKSRPSSDFGQQYPLSKIVVDSGIASNVKDNEEQKDIVSIKRQPSLFRSASFNQHPSGYHKGSLYVDTSGIDCKSDEELDVTQQAHYFVSMPALDGIVRNNDSKYEELHGNLYKIPSVLNSNQLCDAGNGTGNCIPVTDDQIIVQKCNSKQLLVETDLCTDSAFLDYDPSGPTMPSENTQIKENCYSGISKSNSIDLVFNRTLELCFVQRQNGDISTVNNDKNVSTAEIMLPQNLLNEIISAVCPNALTTGNDVRDQALVQITIFNLNVLLTDHEFEFDFIPGGTQSLGIMLSDYKDAVYVALVIDKSLAAEKGLLFGDELISVNNNICCSDYNAKSVVKDLQGPGKVTLKFANIRANANKVKLKRLSSQSNLQTPQICHDTTDSIIIKNRLASEFNNHNKISIKGLIRKLRPRKPKDNSGCKKCYIPLHNDSAACSSFCSENVTVANSLTDISDSVVNVNSLTVDGDYSTGNLKQRVDSQSSETAAYFGIRFKKGIITERVSRDIVGLKIGHCIVEINDRNVIGLDDSALIQRFHNVVGDTVRLVTMDKNFVHKLMKVVDLKDYKSLMNHEASPRSFL